MWTLFLLWAAFLDKRQSLSSLAFLEVDKIAIITQLQKFRCHLDQPGSVAIVDSRHLVVKLRKVN